MLIIVVAVANPAPEEAAARAHTALQGRKMAFRCMVGWGLQPAVFESTKLTWMCVVITARRAPAHLVKSVFCCCSAAGWSFLTRKVPSESSRRALFCGADGGGVRARRSRPTCFVITLTESRHVDRIAKLTDRARFYSLPVYPRFRLVKFTARRTSRSWRLIRAGTKLTGTLDMSIEKKCMVIDFFRQWAASAW